MKSYLKFALIISLSAIFCLNPLLADSPITDSTFTLGTQIETAHYLIFEDNSVFYAKEGRSGAISYSGANKTQVILNAINDLTSGIIWLQDVEFPLNLNLTANITIIEVYNGQMTVYKRPKTLGYLTKYFTDEVRITPANPASIMAEYYNGRTYITYQGHDKDAYITYYDHNLGIWHDDVFIGDNPVGGADGHGAPAILVDSNGYIHVFYGCHTQPIKHSKSTYPENITAWTAKSTIETQATYPCPVLASNGDIYLFYRYYTGSSNHYYTSFVKSTNDGESWSSNTTIINFGTNHAPYYSAIELYNDKAQILWTAHNYSVARRENVYYAYLNLTNLNLYNVTDNSQGTYITLSEAKSNCLVYDSGATKINFGAVHCNPYENGYPYLMYVYGNESDVNIYFRRWTGSAWTAAFHVTNTTYILDHPDFIITGLWTIEAYIPSATQIGHTVGGAIEKWYSGGKGATWNRWLTIMTEETARSMNLNDPMIVRNFNNELKITFGFYQYGTTAYLKSDVTKSKAFAYGDYGFVHRQWWLR